MVVAGGQQRLDDVIFRIGHLGFVRPLDLLASLAALEIVLYENGFPIKIGEGITKVQELFIKRRSLNDEPKVIVTERVSEKGIALLQQEMDVTYRDGISRRNCWRLLASMTR